MASGTATKANRRTIRRAFGEQAVHVISAQDAALSMHAQTIREHAEKWIELSQRVDAARHVADLATKAAQDERERMKSVRARLRWLVLGR